ncbi:MAG: hypothetical protein ACK5IM_10720 [Demequina sp.]|uniref:hypothetical protein n=1 Tax=Demequina sp. TaxID=2050685 RepID=UPI003A8C52CD
MKIRSISTRVAAVAMGAALAVGVAMPASADSTAKVDRGEFAKVVVDKWTLAQVQKEFDSAGTNVTTSSTSRTVKWKTTTSSYGSVNVSFTKTGGKWIVASKSASWGVDAKQTSNKFTQSEFGKVKLNSTLASVQKTAGTSGVVTYEYKSKYTNSRTVEWPVPNFKLGYVSVDFDYENGAWKTYSKYAWWAGSPKQVSNKMTRTEYDKIKENSTTLDGARKIAGSSGTLNSESQSEYSHVRSYDWPVASRYGRVNIDFKYVSGKWTAYDKYAYWG